MHTRGVRAPCCARPDTHSAPPRAPRSQPRVYEAMLNNDQVAAEQIFNETRAKVQRHEAEIANKQAQIQAIKASKHKGDAPPNWGAPPSGWVAPPSNSACIITTPATQPHNHHSRAHPRAHAPTPTLLSVVTSTGVPLPDRRPPPTRRPAAGARA